MNVVQWLAPAVTHPLAVWSVAALLLGWAVASAAALARGTARLRGLLEAARARIAAAPDAAAFAAAFPAISEALGALPLIGPRWHEYRESLVPPAAPGAPVRATARGQAWFEPGGLQRAAGIDARYHAALPNLLVGAGLLFTFLGLAVALGSAGGIVSAGADQGARNAALQALLDTASFKFVTSLVGLLLSIVYALFRKRRLQAVEAALDRFLAALDRRVPLLTPVALQQEANALIARQGAQLAALPDSLAALGPVLERAVDRALERRMGSQLGALATTLQQSNAVSDERMLRVAESLAGLGSRLEGLQGGLGQSAVRLAQSADTMATRMGDGAEASLRAVAQSLTDAARRLEAQMGAQASAGAAKLAQQLEATLAELRALAESSRATGAATFGALAERMAAAAAAFETTAARVAGSLASVADSAGGTLGRGASDAALRIADATEALRATMQAMLGEFQAAIGAAGSTVRERALESGEALRLSVDSAGSALAAAVAGAAADLDGASRTLATLSGGLATQVAAVGDAAERIATRFGEIDRLAHGAAEPLARSAADLKAAGDAASAALVPLRGLADGLAGGVAQIGGAAQAIAAAHEGAAKLSDSLNLASARFENLDREMAGTVEALQDGLRGFTRQVREFVVDTDENLARSATQLGNLAKDLESTIGDFLDQVRRRSA